jgi:hypothetical protein
VIVAAASPIIPEHVALTASDGSFSIPNLFAGQYTVKISMPQFLPALKQGIQLNAGGTAVLTVNLQNALDVVRRAVSRERAKSDDIIWTLRSSRSTEPVLRIADNPQNREPKKTTQGPDYSGYFQVYSKSVDTSAGTSQGVGSQFSVTVPVDTNSRVTVHGNYNEAPTQPRGFGASYDFVPRVHHKTEIAMNMRQGALLTDPVQAEMSREIQVKYGDDFQWSDHFVINYGAEAGRAGTVAGVNYLRPRFSASWVPDSRTTFTFGMSSQAPAVADDPIRGKEYFDRTLYIPAALEHYSHSEIGLTRVASDTVEVSAAVFRDRTDNEALFSSSRSGRPSIVIIDTTNMPSEGLRLHMNRQFRNFEAGVGYTAAVGIGINENSTGSVQDQLVRRQFHSVAARFKARLISTQTEITTVYRWNSALSPARLDPYQRVDEYNDPSLSLSIAQNLPSWRMMPGRVQAILDARNLLDQQYQGSQGNQIGQYPRLVKGGISIRF